MWFATVRSEGAAWCLAGRYCLRPSHWPWPSFVSLLPPGHGMLYGSTVSHVCAPRCAAFEMLTCGHRGLLSSLQDSRSTGQLSILSC